MINNRLFDISDKDIEDKIVSAVKGFKDIVQNAHEKQEKFVEQIITGLYKDNDKEKVNVVTVRCGFGKSIVIKLFLRGLVENRTRDEEFDGAIIVTDSLSRLEEIKSFNGLEDMCALIKYTDNKFLILEDESTASQIKKQYMYPILLMTTQRYERLNKDERAQLYKWKNGDRKVVIFDEKPCLYNQEIIDVEFMSYIKREIDKISESEDKQFLVSEFRKVDYKIEEIKDNLVKGKDEIMWHKASVESLFGNKEVEDKFMSLAKELLKKDIVYRINKILDLNKKGGLFINKKTDKTENKRFFVLLEDNLLRKFDVDKVKYWVFDATAKHDIEYKNNIFKKFNIDDTKEEPLEIINVKENMSKQAMKYKAGKKIKALNKFIANRTEQDEDIIVASYSNVIGKVEGKGNQEKLYFGNIKGSNLYRDICKMFHVGWHRQSDYHYIGLYLMKNKDIINEFNNLSYEETRDKIKELTKVEIRSNSKNIMFENEELNQIMVGKIFCDFVQNIFRTKLRDFSNEKKITIYTFAQENMEELFIIMEKEFNIKIKHIIADEFSTEKIISRQTKKESVAQRIINWWEEYSWSGEMHISEILKINGLTQKQFDKAKEKNKGLKEFMKNNASDRRYHYCNRQALKDM